MTTTTARKTKNESTIDAAAIAKAAVVQGEARMRAARQAAVREWRDLVFGIANGIEPDGASLQRIAELSQILSLPRGVLADHVAAVQEDRRIAEIVDEAGRVGAAAEAGLEKLLADLREAEDRVRSLQMTVNQTYFDLQSAIFIRSRVTEHRERYPLLFDDLDSVEA